MQFTLTIECEGSAFGPNPAPDDYMTRTEVARILQATAVRIGVHAQESGTLLDINGNARGFFDYGVE